MMSEGRNLLNHGLITLEEASKIPKVKIRTGEFKSIPIDGNIERYKILLPSKYRSRADYGFSLRHELWHVTETRINV